MSAGRPAQYIIYDLGSCLVAVVVHVERLRVKVMLSDLKQGRQRGYVHLLATRLRRIGTADARRYLS